MVTERKITGEDHDFIADWIEKEKDRRAKCAERVQKEKIWKEVDRQVAMEPPPRTFKKDWQSNIEPGMLADALETFSDDVLRYAIPHERNWFKPKVQMPIDLDDDDLPNPEEKREQQKRSGALRALMAQQHIDTGLREAVKLSVKEAYKHGSFVAETRFLRFPKWHNGGSVEELGAPVWIPHSMWKCWPAPSGTLQSSSLSYQGSMIIEVDSTWAELAKNQNLINKHKLYQKRDEKKPPVILKFFGDMFVPKEEGDMFLPNMEIWVCNGVMIYAESNELPYPPIIYVTIEKDDVRDDYASSQLIKRSPTHKAAAEALNSFIDATAMSVRPPIAYNSLDPRFAASGLSVLEPGAEIPTRGNSDIKPIFVADPAAAFNGFQVLKQEVERGTKADIRAGVAPSTEQTRFEIEKIDERAEVRTIDFVGVLERHGLRPFLFMQHELNKLYLNDYPFYCDEPNLPTFLRAGKNDLKEIANLASFEITGSNGLLGEQRRREGALYVTQQLLATDRGDRMVGDEGLAEVARDAYADFGVKDPERYIPNAPELGEDGEVEKVSIHEIERLEEELNAALQELQQALGDSQMENFKLTEALERMRTDANSLAEDNKLLEEQIQTIERKVEAENQIRSLRDKVEDRLAEIERREMKLAAQQSQQPGGDK